MSRRLRLGVIGTGLIAQVMHLHYLAELAGSYEVAAVCDAVPDSARACADQYRIGAVFTDWHELVAEPLDAVLVLTSGSHAPIAVAAATMAWPSATEKHIGFSTSTCRPAPAAAERAGRTLMVAYPKRYDPAYARFRVAAGEVAGARMLRVTTFESPLAPYVGHYPLAPRAPVPDSLAAALAAEADEAIAAAIGEADELERYAYRMVLLDTLVHEINTVRGLLGEPDSVDYVDLRQASVTVMLSFGDLPVAIHWLDLPGIARYGMEFALYGPDRRVTLTFPSPFLRNAPAVVDIEGGEAGTARSWRSEEIVSYASGFKRELIAFHEAVVTGQPPETTGLDGLRDIALCQAIIECHRRRAPVAQPTAVRT